MSPLPDPSRGGGSCGNPACRAPLAPAHDYCPRCGWCRRSFEFRAGQIFAGRYRVIGELGRGGFGVVYRAEDLETPGGALLALKILIPDLGEDAAYGPRFRKEFEIGLKFRHPCGVRVHEFGTTREGLLYYTMDCVDGDRLDRVLEERGGFDPPDALSIYDHLLSVVGAAHSLGILHRDIKPSNIILQHDPIRRHRVRLLDFGIAKLRSTDPITVTQGIALGTPEYMPPEQFMGGSLDETADIYSATAVLHHMLFGAPPFRCASRTDYLRHKAAGPPEIPGRFPRGDPVPPFVIELLRKGMTARRHAREFTRAELARAFLENEVSRRAGGRRRGR